MNSVRVSLLVAYQSWPEVSCAGSTTQATTAIKMTPVVLQDQRIDKFLSWNADAPFEK